MLFFACYVLHTVSFTERHSKSFLVLLSGFYSTLHCKVSLLTFQGSQLSDFISRDKSPPLKCLNKHCVVPQILYNFLSLLEFSELLN